MTILLRRFAVCLALVLLLAPWPAEAAAPVLADRVAEISTTNGTGSVTLAGALAGHVTFGTAVGVGNTTYYAIVHKSGTQWEVGLGTLTGASTLARTLVYSTWTGGTLCTAGCAPISLAAGTKDVFVTAPAAAFGIGTIAGPRASGGNDSTEVQKAITAATPGCGVVLLPDSDYLANLTVPSCVTLQGTPRGLVSYVGSPLAPVRITTADATGATAVITVAAGATNWTIRDLNLYGHGSGSADRGILAAEAYRGTIERVTVQNTAEEGIRWVAGADLHLTLVKTVNVLLTTSRSAHSGGVYLGGNDSVIRDSELNGPNAGALVSSNQYVHALAVIGSNAVVDNVSMAFADAGGYVGSGSSNSVFTNCRAEYNWGHGFLVDGSATFIGCKANTNSRETSNTYDGWRVNGYNSVFTGNQAYTVFGAVSGDPLHKYGINDTTTGATNRSVYGEFQMPDTSVGTAKFTSLVPPAGISRPFSIGEGSSGSSAPIPENTTLWTQGYGGVSASIPRNRFSFGADHNWDYGGYCGVLNTGSANMVGVCGTREVTVDYPAIYFNLGNVGIGTTTPAEKLDVAGSIQASDPQIIAGTGTGMTVNKLAVMQRVIHKVTATYDEFLAAATQADKVIATLPPKTRLVSIITETTVGFTGGAISGTSLIVGKTTGGNQYILTHSVYGTTVRGLVDLELGNSINRDNAVQGGDLPSWTTTTDISARITTAGAFTNELTAGSVAVYLITEKFP